MPGEYIWVVSHFLSHFLSHWWYMYARWVYFSIVTFSVTFSVTLMIYVCQVSTFEYCHIFCHIFCHINDICMPGEYIWVTFSVTFSAGRDRMVVRFKSVCNQCLSKRPSPKAHPLRQKHPHPQINTFFYIDDGIKHTCFKIQMSHKLILKKILKIENTKVYI